jgi:phosphorylcholine metabolism protein LicD
MTTCDYNKSKYVGVLGSQYGSKDYCSKAAYEETLRCPFEDIEVNVPIGYDENLTNLHGSNWNQIPDKSKQKTHHKFTAYDMGDTSVYNNYFKL